MTRYRPPPDWNSLTLGQLTESTRPICYGVLKPGESDDQGVPLVRVTDISSNQFDDSHLMRIKPSLDEEFRRSRLKGGELLLSIQGTIGRVAICPERYSGANISRTIAVIEPDGRVDRRFIYFFLRYLGDTSAFHTVGTTRSSLNIETLRRVTVPIPPLSEQRWIAEILDKADALRTKRRAALAQLDTLTQSIFLAMFGDPATNPKRWPVTRLESEITSVRYGTGSPPPYVEEGVPFIRATNIKAGTVLPRDLKRISLDEATRIDKCRVQAGNLIIVRSGVNTGDCAIVPSEFDGACAAFDLIVELPRANAFFYNFLINSPHGKRYLEPLTRRAAQAHLNAEQVKSIRFISPDLRAKERFADVVVAINSVKAKYGVNLAELDTLFGSLQHRAFRGEL